MVEDNSQSQFSQTQSQSQTQTQQIHPSQETRDIFPAHLWGILVSTAGDPTGLQNYVSRPSRVEMDINGDGPRQCVVGRARGRVALFLDSAKISNTHATIWADSEGIVRVKDESTNGTYICGKKIGKGNIGLLQPGNEIIFGPINNTPNDFRYIFQGPTWPRSQRFKPDTSTNGFHQHYQIMEQLGKGSFATVHKAADKRTGEFVAVKIIRKSHVLVKSDIVQREISILNRLDHKYCVRFLEFFEDKDHIWLILEYVNGGDLLDYIMKHEGLSERETRELALMVCEAVAYLHSQGIVHRDLKPENLLMTRGERPLCKVTDFGLAKIADSRTFLKTKCGTPGYLAPEVILSSAIDGYSERVDTWSIGVIVFCCLTNSTFFDSSKTTDVELLSTELKTNLRSLERMQISKYAFDFVKQCLQENPKYRMSVSEALKHPWLIRSDFEGNEASFFLQSIPNSLEYRDNLSSIATGNSVWSDIVSEYEEPVLDKDEEMIEMSAGTTSVSVSTLQNLTLNQQATPSLLKLPRSHFSSPTPSPEVTGSSSSASLSQPNKKIRKVREFDPPDVAGQYQIPEEEGEMKPPPIKRVVRKNVLAEVSGQLG